MIPESPGLITEVGKLIIAELSGVSFRESFHFHLSCSMLVELELIVSWRNAKVVTYLSTLLTQKACISLDQESKRIRMYFTRNVLIFLRNTEAGPKSSDLDFDACE